MRRILAGLCFASLLACAQEHGATPAPEVSAHGEHSTTSDEQHGDPLIVWKWANFALLAIGLGILAKKHAPAYFASRNTEIREGLAAAAAMKRESDAKVTSIEARLKNLEGEIAAIRSQAAAERAAEEVRLRKEAEAAIAKIRQHVQVEIASATKQAQSELRVFGAELALRSAEERLRGRLNPATEAGLLNRFLKGLNN